jgi:HPt (histidine-containing phosphotransfer) domain-containing protein
MGSIRAYEPQDSTPVDIEDLIGRCLGRIDLAERILQTFQTALESDLTKLEAAVAAFDADEIAHVAHRIRGASLAVSAHKLTDCAQSIELSAKAQRLDEIPEHMATLKSESARLDDLSSLLAEGPNC